MLVPIRNLGQVGVVYDVPGHELPANVWTDARGVRFYDNSVWKAYGQEAVLGTPTVAPYYLYPYLTSSGRLWAYPGLAKIYATDGTTHSDLTRSVGGDYTGDADDIWQGTGLSNIIIFNNGKDVPQAWITPALGTRCIDLANWPASTEAKVIKAYKQYLIALNVTKSSVAYPQLIKWSHVADPGSVPSSWDETDATVDAGEYALAESDGHIIDGMRLGDEFLVYKEDETHAMNLIGGRFIFSIRRRFKTGVFGPRCIAEHKGKHIVALPDDVIIHDGFQQESILDDRMRRWYDGQADTDVQQRMFVVYNSRENEVWVCIPQIGASHPNIALVINIKDGTQTLRDLPEPTFIAAAPIDPTAGATTFDSQTTIFDDMVGTFGQRVTKVGANRLVGSHIATTNRFLLYDNTFGDEGVDFRGYVEKTSSPIAGLSRDGNVLLDPSQIKQVNEIWPEIRQQGGAGVDIYVGGQDTLEDPITWEGPLTFVSGTDDKVDCCTVGRYLSIRFETTDQSQWKLDGYSMNVELLGQQ